MIEEMESGTNSATSSSPSDASPSPGPGPSNRQTLGQLSPHKNHQEDLSASHSPIGPSFHVPIPSDESPQSDAGAFLDVNQESRIPNLQPLSPTKPISVQIHPEILHNPYANPPLGESSYFTRPNRYFGPASTWRSWTETDRAVSASLDKLRAEDLSLHLFNAFSLRRRVEARKRERVEGLRRDSGDAEPKDMEQEAPDSEDDPEADEFVPPRIWTAWPLPPAEVPRVEFLQSMDNAGIVRRGKDMRPSAVLEECLIASATRFAKERWESRQWEDETNEKADKEAKTEDIKKKIIRTSDVSMYDVENTEQNVTTAVSTIPSDIPPPPPDESPSYPSDEGSFEYFSSQAFAPPSPTMSSGDFDNDQATRHRPVFTADDDRARDLLLPSTRHIISKLDELLAAAHKSRKSYAYGQSSKSRSHSRSKSKGIRDSPSYGTEVHHEDQSEVNSDKSNTKTGPDYSRSRKRHRSAGGRNTSSRRSASGSQSVPRSSSAALQPHDWSSVLGLAMITGGFKPETVSRATERCARLFSEKMLIRTFYEAGPTLRKTSMLGKEEVYKEKKGPWFEESFIVQDDDDGDALQDDNVFEAETIKLMQPREEMVTVRASAACTRCRENKLRCDPSAPETQEQSMLLTCKSCLKEGTTCSGISSKMVPVGNPNLVCPYEKCRRHKKPFDKRYNLQRHITLAHGGESVPDSQPAGQADRWTVLGDHRSPGAAVDEIFCPVNDCPRAEGGQPFRRGHAMYEHVKKMHHNIDLEMVKTMLRQKRGERRGRWTDERRHRSRSEHSRSKSQRSHNTDSDEHLE